jgi:hypothetical protein
MLEEGNALSLALSVCTNEEEDGWEYEEFLRSSRPRRFRTLKPIIDLTSKPTNDTTE